MSKVYNWQLGRDMHYPYEEAHPEWQFAAVFNINRCIACQTCTMACKSTWTFSRGQEHMWWNNVETKPYGGYPQGWDVKTLKLLEEANPGKQIWEAHEKGEKAPYGEYEGKTIFEAAPGRNSVLGYLPKDQDWRFPNIHEDTSTKYVGDSLGISKTGVTLPEHKAWFFYLQRICNHCTYPGCLAACPRNAIYKRPEDGVVLVDQSRCRGYRKCMEACPYKKTMHNIETRITEKCIGCYPRVQGQEPLTGGVPTETRCMASCVGQIRLQGLVPVDPKTKDWKSDPKNPLYYLVRIAKVALPLYPQFGTEPNIYYIPPRWVPRDYLHQMFGPGVDQAIETYQNPSRELLAVLQLFRKDRRIIFHYDIEQGEKAHEILLRGKKRTIYDDTITAYGKENQELFKVKVEEPFYIRGKERTNAV